MFRNFSPFAPTVETNIFYSLSCLSFALHEISLTYSEYAFLTQVNEKISHFFLVNRCAFQTNLAAGATSIPTENKILATH